MELLQSTIHLNKNQTTSNDGNEIHITVYTSDEESIKEEIQKHKKTKAGSKDMASKNAQFKAGEGCFAKVQDQQFISNLHWTKIRFVGSPSGRQR